VLGAGQTWYGGEELGEHLRADLSYPLLHGPAGTLRLGAGAERQWREEGPVDAASLRAEAVRALPGGARLGLAVTWREVSGEALNTSNRWFSAEATLDLARPVGPARIALAAEAGRRDWDFYALGPIGVTDGREDRYAALSVEAAFPGLARYGYMPKVTLTAEETWSNISRFETRTLGLTFGFASQF